MLQRSATFATSALALTLYGCSATPEPVAAEPSSEPESAREACLADSPHPFTLWQGPAGDWACDEGTTGLVLLALLEEGNTPDRGAERETVARGLAWLLAGQGPDGAFGHDWEGSAWATLALSESLYFTQSEALREPVERGVRHLVMHCPEEGAGLLLLVLASARDAGCEVHEELVGWLLEIEADPDDLAQAALLQLGFLLHERGTVSAERAASLIERGAQLSHREDARELFCLSLLMYQVGGRSWTEWSRLQKAAFTDYWREWSRELQPQPDDPRTPDREGLRRCAWLALTTSIYFRYARMVGAR